MSGAAGVLARVRRAGRPAGVGRRSPGRRRRAGRRRRRRCSRREARLLDRGRLAAWLDWFTDDAVVWVPLTAPRPPGRRPVAVPRRPAPARRARRLARRAVGVGPAPGRRRACARSARSRRGATADDGRGRQLDVHDPRAPPRRGPGRSPAARSTSSSGPTCAAGRRSSSSPSSPSACATRASCCDPIPVRRSTGTRPLIAGPCDRVHRRLYTDPALFELEQTRVFAASWCFLAHESQLAGAGDFVTTTVGGRPVVVTRGGDGADPRPAQPLRPPRRRRRRRRRGVRQALHLPVPRLDVRRRRPARRPAVPGQPPRRRPRRRSGSAASPSQSYRGFVFGTLHPDPEPVIDVAGPGDARPST